MQNISHHTTGNRTEDAIRWLHGKPLSVHHHELTDLTWSSNIRHRCLPCDHNTHYLWASNSKSPHISQFRKNKIEKFSCLRSDIIITKFNKIVKATRATIKYKTIRHQGSHYLWACKLLLKLEMIESSQGNYFFFF